jgi:mRNA interferase RelE/StbE
VAFKILYSKSSIKQISKLDKVVKTRLEEEIKTKLSIDPIKCSKVLKDFPIPDTRRFRVGDYRIIFTIEKDVVVIYRVGHRRDIYK